MDSEDDIEERRRKIRGDTAASIRRRRTDVERWKTIDLSAVSYWHERAVAAAPFIPPGVRVLDVGCGDMKLETVLRGDCTYIPLDVVRRDERTLVVDLNKQRLPKIDADFVAGLGVLEYLIDLPAVLRQLSRQIPRGLFSYYPLEQRPAFDRLAVGWYNALNTPELLAIMRHSGYRDVIVHRYKPGSLLLEVSRGHGAKPPSTGVTD